MKKLVCLLLTALLCLSLVACGGSSEPAAQTTPDPGQETPAGRADKESIVIAIGSEPTCLDPQIASDDGPMRKVTCNVYEALVRLEGTTLEPQCILAESYERIDDLTMQFKLRQGIKFHDGSDFTADDVVYNVARAVNPDNNAQLYSLISTIKEAVKVDDYTVNIVTNNPDPVLITRLSLLMMLPENFAEEHDVYTEACGTGPYKFLQWSAGDNITLEYFDGYWGEAPQIKNVKVRFIEEPLTALSALQAKEVDLVENMLPEYVEDIPKVFSGETYDTYHMRFNQMGTSIMSDVRLRLACEYAVDTDGIADAIFLGYATPAPGMLGKPQYTGCHKTLQNYGYDPEKAKALMAEAGYNGEEIEIVAERGRWLKDGEVVEAVAAQLTEVGFNVKTTFMSWNEWLDLLFQKDKAPDLFFCSQGNDLFDADRPLGTLACNQGNQSAVLPSEWDDKIAYAATVVDEVERQKLYDEIYEHFHEDPFCIYLISPDSIWGGQTDMEYAPRIDGELYIATVNYL